MDGWNVTRVIPWQTVLLLVEWSETPERDLTAVNTELSARCRLRVELPQW